MASNTGILNRSYDLPYVVAAYGMNGSFTGRGRAQYFCAMRVHGWWEHLSMLLLAVMVAWSVPRTFFHECAHADVAAFSGDHKVTLQGDGHCAICDQAAPSSADGPSVLFLQVPLGYILLGTSVALQVSDGALAEAASRGPPACC
jgi:hypothetical protein